MATLRQRISRWANWSLILLSLAGAVTLFVWIGKASTTLLIGSITVIALLFGFAFVHEKHPRAYKAIALALAGIIAVLFAIGLLGGLLQAFTDSGACSPAEARFGMCD